MSNKTPLINGVRHSWSSIKINILGRTVTGVTAISYSDSEDKVDHHGAGKYAVHRGRGNYKAEAKITLFAYEVDAIARAAGGRITDIDMFDITVVYLPEGQDGLITHVIRNVEFTGNKRDAKQGDSAIEVELDLITSHIDWVA